MTASSCSAAARDVPPPLLLLTCLHMGVAASASPADVQRAFGVLRTLLSNRREHPTEPRYASFSATSVAWVRHVTPVVYVLRLAAWMGCALDEEGTRYRFVDELRPGTGDADARAVLSDRLDELHCVASVWSADATSAFQAPQTEGDGGDGAGGARHALLELFGRVAASAERDDVWATYSRHLLLHRLLCYAHATADTSAGQPAREGAGSWVARAETELRRCPWKTTAAAAAADAFAACVATDAMRRYLARAPLCEVQLLCESVSATAAAAAVAVSSSASSPPSRAAALPTFSASVADRLRQRAQQEQRQRYLATTGPAYRRLCQEERHRGESVIVGIAGLLEQLALVRETQGMVRQDRHEARRLLDAFRQDGDLAKLYALEERYTAELEAAKELYGKPLVYAQPPDA